MTERASDSDGSEVGLSAAADEEVVEIGSDLDEDMSHDEPTPRQADNSAEPTTAPVATDEPRPPAQQAPSADLDNLDPNTATDRERHLLADYTRKSQANAEARKANEATAARLQALEARLNAPPAQQAQDPLAALRATLTEEESRALDLVQTLNQHTMGSRLETYEQRQAQSEDVIKALAVHLLQNRANESNEAAQAARERYPDIDAYAAQVNALSSVQNPATQRPYTPTEAYELIRGIAAQKSADLSASDQLVRAGAASQTTPASPVPVSPTGGSELSTGEVMDGLKQLGFG
jgi:uncharacterized coiled-coil protein SlyX|tara:strand:+ start:1979 stop:2857 length:879 start_codon:yes stop_codon:yes gene_type:complete